MSAGDTSSESCAQEVLEEGEEGEEEGSAPRVMGSNCCLAAGGQGQDFCHPRQGHVYDQAHHSASRRCFGQSDPLWCRGVSQMTRKSLDGGSVVEDPTSFRQ